MVYIIIEHRAKEQCQAICFDVGCAAATPLMQQCVFFLKKIHGSFNGNERSGREHKTFDDHLFWCTLKWPEMLDVICYHRRS